MNRAKNKPSAKSSANLIEGLEDRLLMAAPPLSQAWVKSGVLNIQGTAGYDNIYVTYGVGGVNVYDHSTKIGVFAPTSFTKISVNVFAGNDAVYIGYGNYATYIDGGLGNDNLYGGGGNDTMLGGAGIDVLTGNGGDDNLDGGADSDTVNGNTGNDTVLGGDGNDLIGGQAGKDFLDGGFGADVINGGDDVDTVSYANRTKSVFVDATGYGKGETADDGEAGEKDFVDADVENIIGGAGNDVLIGNSDPNNNYAGKFISQNKIIGGKGNDTIKGLDGNDILDGGLGADLLIGGLGVDLADYSNRTENLTIRLDDKANDGAPNEGDNVSTDIENVAGGSGNDLIYGNNLANALFGNGGKDTLYGLGGNDQLTGGAGNDQLFGGDGNDILYARDLGVLPKDPAAKAAAIAAAADKLDGGIGTDSAQYDIADTTTSIEKILA